MTITKVEKDLTHQIDTKEKRNTHKCLYINQESVSQNKTHDYNNTFIPKASTA